MRDFFISYTNVDEPWAVWIAFMLEEAGYTVFIQAWDILPGDNFMAKMQEAMTQTNKTIAVLSEDYPKSQHAEDEWTDAARRRALVPVRVRPWEPAGIFATTVYVDIVGFKEQDVRTAILGAFSTRANAESTPPLTLRPGHRKPKQSPPYPGAPPVGAALSALNVTGKIIDTVGSQDLSTAPLHGHVSAATPVLTAEERVKLYKSLNKLSLSQFNILVFALRLPPGAVPPLPATQEERVSALLSWAEGAQGRGLGEVRGAFEEMLKPDEEAPEESAEADRGADVVKMCDRSEQEENFSTFLKLCCDWRRGHAQLYVIEGREMEGHKSLVERFCATTLMARAGGVRPTPWELGWPQTGHPRVDVKRIVSLLFEETGRDDEDGPMPSRAYAFRGVVTSLPPVVVVMHKIEAHHWLRTTGRVIRSYAEFWDEFGRAYVEQGPPLFVVFLNVVYPAPRQGSLPRRLQRWLLIRRVKLGLRWLALRMRSRSPLKEDAPQSAAFALLRELPCVSVKHVKEWMERHGYGRYEGEWLAKSQQLFIRNGWNIFECRSMADVELALSEFVDERRRVNRAYT
jgi:hypothetical protein